MFKFCNLFSGSSGNCSLIQTDNCNILIDAGTSCRKINTALSSMGLSLSDIDAIFITHEHMDHIQGLDIINKKYSLPIYANKKTLENLNMPLSDDIKNTFKNNEKFEFKDLKIMPFSIPHDAADPCGFSFINSNKKLTIATDIGHMTNSIMDNLVGSNYLLLESNYEPDMLKSSNYPYPLKKRILGPDGHLSNDEAGNTISTLLSYGVKEFALGHLSKNTNFPELAYQTVMNSIINHQSDVDNLSLTVSDRDKPDDTVNIA